MLPAALGQTLSNETVLGVYMFHRHGDRTAKAWPPANLTDLGYKEVYMSGQYYRSRYIDSDATYKIYGIASDIVDESQISVSSPLDTVLQNSAMGFLQGLYPPVGSSLDTELLRNGTTITAPLSGYQLIPVDVVSGGTGEENDVWLQGDSGCARATIDSNDYFLSQQYNELLHSTESFYQSLLPVVNSTFDSSELNYKNAYTIFDYINVAEIHNVSFHPGNVITNETFHQLFTLASAHEWGLAYNKSANMSAIAAMVVAAQAVDFLNNTINSNGSSGTGKIGIQFGAYGTFSSFFGLAIPDIDAVDPNLYGICDYASSMVWEMFTNTSTPVTPTSFPSTDEIFVRFMFHNGSASNVSEPRLYPLFGSNQTVLSWKDFTDGMSKFSIGTTEQWCNSCGNTTGTCAAYAPSGSSGSSTSGTNNDHNGNGLSPAVNGVIGAMVTLAVVLGVEALIMLLFGLRLVRKSTLVHNAGAGVGASSAEPKA
ncbi:hypothetical protein M433DRAFT_61756 [Acidomyces richmondensis BFW]|nr:MAG: hypothetical protein FE78DRAFT_138470 [Acidomyces sp. 'richmondensis']KYG48120.1 hypothetical protein M433DRAFT_61756 [Acidomyces richmondensis BFW]